MSGPILRPWQRARLLNEVNEKVGGAIYGIGPGFNQIVIANGRTKLDAGLTDVGTLESVTYRYRWRSIGSQDVSDIRAMFGNWGTVSSGEIVGTGDMNVKAAIETDAGSIFPLYFNGKRTVTIEPGGTVVSDPLGITLVSSSRFWTRTYVSVASGVQYCRGIQMGFSKNEGLRVNTDVSDTGSVTGQTVFGYGPIAVFGSVVEPVPGVGIIGSSTFAGQGDINPIGDDDDGNLGVAARGIGNNFGYMLLARASESASSFLNPLTSHRRMAALNDHVTHIISNLGAIDISNGNGVDTVKDLLTRLWTNLANRGYKVFQVTFTPVTSSDGVTQDGNWARRSEINDWIRTKPAPLTGYFDMADFAETSRNSGQWKPGYTSDGTHLVNSAYGVVAQCIDVSQIRLT